MLDVDLNAGLLQGGEGVVPDHVSELPSDVSEESVVELDSVKQYKNCVEELHNIGEDHHSLKKYKQAVINLLLGSHITSR